MKNQTLAILFIAITAIITLFVLMRSSTAQAQSSGNIIVVGEDSSRGVVCYATSRSTDHISCVKVH